MKKLFFGLCLVFVFASCKKDAANDVSQFQGTWTGTYTSAGENGTFNVVIDKEGNATGSSTSQVFDETFQLVGTVNSSGNIALTFGSASSGGSFSGTLKSNTGSGTWENKMTTPNYSGTWTGNKQ